MPGITRAAQARCPQETQKPQNQAAAAEIAQAALTENNLLLSDLFQVFLIVNAIIIGISLISRFIPVARPLVLAAAVARTQVATVMTRISTQRAANDRLFQVLEQLKRAA